MTTSGPRPVVTWILMALSAIAAFVLPNFLLTPSREPSRASAATGAVCRMAAEELGLHRIQAATLSNNIASRRVLEHCAFHEIGFAPQYLRINGRWQDHVLFQRILHD